MWEKIGGTKVWQIWRIVLFSPHFIYQLQKSKYICKFVKFLPPNRFMADSPNFSPANFPSLTVLLLLSRTCYYALCLIAKTKRGVEQLKQLGWVSVCHSHEHKWPVVNKRTSSTSSTSSSSRADTLVRGKVPFQHQSSLPAVVLTSTDTPECAAARRKALLKKYTNTMKVTGNVVHNQKITEGKVSEYSDQEFHVGSAPDQPPKMRNGNASSQQRPISMLSFSSR